jgi:hypothetical protein
MMKPMTKRRLTEEFLQELRPPETGKVDFYDAGMPGLILRNNYGGRMSWCVLHYVKKTDGNGKPKTIPTTKKIGKWPNLSLKEARQLTKRFDPQQAAKDARDRQASRTFQDVAEHWIVEHVEGQGLRTAKETRAMCSHSGMGARSAICAASTSKTSSVTSPRTTGRPNLRRCCARSTV